ncbi:MAG TPA: cellulase family glycosylhydrolase [Ktedonobacteraceae bacterium]|nr:cellulase family glycosylhydrolase [Ktedonobacteraceae bacterium]
MKNSRPPTGPLPRPNKFAGRLRLLAGFLLVLVVLAIVFVILVQKQVFSGGNPSQSQTSATSTTAGGQLCNVTKNSDGSYHFSWLHVNATGDIVDSNNCRVPLLGWNAIGAFQGAGGSLGTSAVSSSIHINVVRVAFNSRWYESDVYVPNQHMHFKAWLQKIVSTLESRGDYVMLDANNAFFEPPCGSDGAGTTITFCPAEDQGRKDYSNPSSPYYHNVGGLELYQPIAIQALTDLAKLYANDPAVLFDVWNEPGRYIFVTPNSAQNKVPDMNQRINIVRQYDPQSLIFVFAAGINEDLSYKQSNLVFDFHIYPGFKGVSPVTHTSCPTSSSNIPKLQQTFTALRKAGRAIFIGEWGHCYDAPSYNQQIVSLAKTYNAGLAYFDETDLFTKSNAAKQLNANGQLVQQDYNSLFG